MNDLYTLHRRFDRFGRLIGDEAMEKLMHSHVMIVGLGGVGSWAAESLARSGIGQLTIVDFDEICITNTNRQIHTLSGLIGEKKAEVFGERLKKINPQAKINILSMFYNAENSEQILSYKPEIVLDCIDNITAKCHLLSTCKERGIKVICSGGSGSKIDPTKILDVDLAETHTDPFLAQIRKVLRTKYNFPSEGKMDIPSIFSTEIPSEPIDLHYDKGQGFKCVCPQGQNNLHSCDKRNVIHGTASFVTGTFGFLMASVAVRMLLNKYQV